MFTFTVLTILLSKSRSVLKAAQRGTRSKTVKVSVENHKNMPNFWNWLKSNLISRLWGFEWFLICLLSLFFLTLSVPQKLRNSSFKMLTIPQTLNINSVRTTSVKSFNVHFIRNYIEYSLKNSPSGNAYFHFFEILLSEYRSILSPAQRWRGIESFKVSLKNQKKSYFLKLLEN